MSASHTACVRMGGAAGAVLREARGRQEAGGRQRKATRSLGPGGLPLLAAGHRASGSSLPMFFVKLRPPPIVPSP
ncbi:hypothetical protein ON010_g16229 [Phytophthora cinnamomi]|nr:hypothetical protein ON010_g16229 [Phytophthora cinnamomi]